MGIDPSLDTPWSSTALSGVGALRLMQQGLIPASSALSLAKHLTHPEFVSSKG